MPRPKRKKTGPTIEDETSLWEFIFENVCQKKMYDSVESSLFEHYLEDNEVPWTLKELSEFYSKTMEPALYKATLDVEKILALYKILEIEIEPHAEKMLELRSEAGLRVDSDRCLIHYEFYRPRNKRQLETPKRVEERIEDSVEPEGSMPKKVKPGPSPVKSVSEKMIVPESTPAKQSMEEERNSERTPQETPRPLATSTPHAAASVEEEIPEEFNKLMWDHIRENFSTMTSSKIISIEFWEEILENHGMVVKSATRVLEHFHKNHLKKLWRQKLDPSIKMRLIKELRVPLNRAQQRWLLEYEGVDLKLAEDGYVESWEVTEVMKADEEQAPSSAPPRNINTWVPRHRPENDFSDAFTSAQSHSRHDSISSRAQTGHRHAFHGTIPKLEDTSMMETRRDKRIPFTYEDDVLAWKFILNKAYDPKKKVIRREILPKGMQFWDVFIRQFNSPKTSSNWCSHYRKKMMGNLHTMPFSKDTMLPLYRALEIPITSNVRKTLAKKFAAKIDVDSKGFIKNWTFVDENGREQTKDTEPLVNEDEETDEESVTANPLDSDIHNPSAIADEMTTLTTTASMSSTPQLVQPSTSKQQSQHRKRRQSSESDHPIKRRSLKLVEVDDEEEANGTVVVKTAASSGKLDRHETRTSRKVVAPEVEEEEGEKVFIEPLDLKEIDGNSVSTHELLAVIKNMMTTTQIDEEFEVVSKGVLKAFLRSNSDKEENFEEIADKRVSQSINKTRGHLRRVLFANKDELVARTIDNCENQEVFRKRISATTAQLNRCLLKLNPTDPPLSTD